MGKSKQELKAVREVLGARDGESALAAAARMRHEVDHLQRALEAAQKTVEVRVLGGTAWVSRRLLDPFGRPVNVQCAAVIDPNFPY